MVRGGGLVRGGGVWTIPLVNTTTTPGQDHHHPAEYIREVQSMGGRYASDWNAFFFEIIRDIKKSLKLSANLCSNLFCVDTAYLWAYMAVLVNSFY